MNLKHVLVLDCSEDISRNATFLLKLAGYRVTVVQDAVEMVNWITTCQGDSNPVDLLLVNKIEWQEEAPVVVDAIREFCQTLPILFVDRDVTCKGVIKILIRDEGVSSFHMCSPDSIVESLNDILGEANGPKKRCEVDQIKNGFRLNQSAGATEQSSED